MEINSSFDSGAVVVVNVDDKAGKADLNIRVDAEDQGGPFMQWWHFRAVGLTPGKSYTYSLLNAGESSYPGGWPDYKTYASYDRQTWFRIQDTSYTNGVLTWTHKPEHGSIFFSYYPPYSQERLLDYVSQCQMSESGRCALTSIGTTPDGHTLDCLLIGETPPSLPAPVALPATPKPSDGKLKMWIFARQHPGETQASWWIEGFVNRLLDTSDPVVTKVLAAADFFVVPNMNPDGSKRGYLRVNALGANLNREWKEPTMEKSPEVYQLQQHMFATGVDFALDVHSEEELPYVFFSHTPKAIPSITDKQLQMHDKYAAALQKANPDFQTVHGYPREEPGQANLGIACAWAAEIFGCLSMTQEQPFKDNIELPDAKYGWSVHRSRKLGYTCLDAIYAVLDDLKH